VNRLREKTRNNKNVGFCGGFYFLVHFKKIEVNEKSTNADLFGYISSNVKGSLLHSSQKPLPTKPKFWERDERDEDVCSTLRMRHARG